MSKGVKIAQSKAFEFIEFVIYLKKKFLNVTAIMGLHFHCSNKHRRLEENALAKN